MRFKNFNFRMERKKNFMPFRWVFHRLIFCLFIILTINLVTLAQSVNDKCLEPIPKVKRGCK